MSVETRIEPLDLQIANLEDVKLSPFNGKAIVESDASTRAGSTVLDSMTPSADSALKSIQIPSSKGSKVSCYDFEIAVPKPDNKRSSMSLFEIAEAPMSATFPTSATLPAPVQERVLRGWILLNPGISKTNFYAGWFFSMYFGAILLSFSTIEPQYISQAFNIPAEVMGKMTAELYLIDYSIRLCFAMIWGPAIDHFGRKFVLTIGVILLSAGYLVIPFLNSGLFSGYLIGKSLISCGIIAISMLPFSADYVDNSTKGVMTGINFAVGFIGGAISGLFMKILLELGLSCRELYWAYAPVILIFGFCIRAGIKEGNTYFKTQPPIQSASAEQILKDSSKWKEVSKAYREIPWVSIGVIFGILGNTDFYVMTTGLMIWLKSLLPADQDPTSLGTTYQIVFFGLSFITTMVAAVKIDKVPHMRVIFPVLIIATLGFIIIPFINGPTSILMYVFFIIEGLSLPGVFIFSTYLAIRYNPPEIRGTLSGIGNGVGFFGGIIILSLGGYLHDHWRTDSSFILYGGLLLFTLLAVSLIYITMMRKNVKPNDPDNIQLNVEPKQGIELVFSPE